MNFVEYDHNTLKCLYFGSMKESTLDDVISAGRPVIRITEWPADFDLRLYDVDVGTKSLVRNSSSIPAADQLQLPILPVVISDRQFYQQAAIDGYITKQDALAAVQTGFIPAVLQSIVDQIADENERFNAEMILAGSTTFRRDHPLTNQIGAALGKTSEQMDQFFSAALVL